jgi:hypothetical protein
MQERKIWSVRKVAWVFPEIGNRLLVHGPHALSMFKNRNHGRSASARPQSLAPLFTGCQS